MADRFLSCDGDVMCRSTTQHKKEQPSMITISTISASLSTDDSPLFRRRKPLVPRICCILPVNAGTMVATIVTTGGEVSNEAAKDESGATLIDLVLFRLGLSACTLIDTVVVYSYVRSFIYIRSLRRNMSS
uniref:G_PROTEIN_RECEP_F1_2 domain-containing protein n=1 Tax=Heterorhabditis bacteriophora TaxID=37862 RepID=A0A1I7XQX6_HETBA